MTGSRTIFTNGDTAAARWLDYQKAVYVLENTLGR